MKRIQNFRQFRVHESMDMPADNVRIFEEDQYQECCDHVNGLTDALGVVCHWSLIGREGLWHGYVRNGKMFAVIETGGLDESKALIGALLGPDGEVEMAFYNDDSECPIEVAEEHLGPKMFHKDESFRSEYEEETVCRKCGCDCQVCECDECDCGDSGREEGMRMESSEWSMELSPDLIDAIDKGDQQSVDALLEAGADLSYRNYYPIKRAIKAAHMAMGNRRMFDTHMDIVETLITELDYISGSAVEEIMITLEDVPSSISVFVKNLLADVDVESDEPSAAPAAQREFERYSMMERKRASKKTSTSYKKSGLKHPAKADLNKDKKISGYEKVRGKAIQKSLQAQKEEEGPEKGLTAAQKKLPPGLRKAILARKKK